MNRVEQAYYEYISAKILPILKSYSGRTISTELAKEINDKIIAKIMLLVW